ncbi:MAG TPA: hypothetical protein VF794_21010 [Archangium sp.]|jgi:hypothetical protein|uniref:hypothetical protein n=1 Tax=Archangium sp. TaxID=1872627 RepID=UPI002ED9546E
MRAALFVAWGLLAVPGAWAQDEVPAATRPERLYVNSGVLMGSSRVVALGGAYVGIAEGVAGFNSNLAALAHRSPNLDRDWDVGVTLSWLDLPLAKAKGKDLDNDGLADDAPETLQVLGGVLLQYRNFGLGFSLRNYQVGYCNTVHCDPKDLLRVSLLQTALAGAVALGHDEFILGFGIYSAQAVFSHQAEGAWRYGDTGLALDVLYRPLGRPYRLGVSVRPEVVGAWRREAGQVPFLAGRQLYSAVVSPAVLSLGVSWRLGEGAERYNRLSPAARRQMLEGEHFTELPPEDEKTGLAGRWLLSAQADFISRAENAVSVHSFTALTEPTKVGAAGMLQPRVGVEHETWPGRLRTRLGAFIEPSPFADHLPRPHLTGGFELFLFRYWEDWALTASFDASRRYSNFGVSVGFWR